MKTLCLVGCCKTKLVRAAPARELYCSPLFQLCRRWAERHADVWAILSARCGVVLPDEVIEPYDTTIAQRRPFGQPKLSPREFGNWIYGTVQLWRSKYSTRYPAAPLTILAGKDYWQWLVGRMEFRLPLDGLGIGARLKWLKEQTAEPLKPGTPYPKQLSLFSDDPHPYESSDCS